MDGMKCSCPEMLKDKCFIKKTWGRGNHTFAELDRIVLYIFLTNLHVAKCINGRFFLFDTASHFSNSETILYVLD